VVLDLGCGQNAKQNQIIFTQEPTTFTHRAGNIKCSCQDDGSLVLWELNEFDKRWNRVRHLCSLEVKRAFTNFDEEGKGIETQTVQAQQFCELLGAAVDSKTNIYTEEITSLSVGSVVRMIFHSIFIMLICIV